MVRAGRGHTAWCSRYVGVIRSADSTGSRRLRLALAVSVIAGTCLVSARVGVAETSAGAGRIAAGGVVRVHVPEAVGGKTVVGELTVDGAVGAGFVTAYGCASGLPVSAGVVTRSDLNYDGRLTPVASNRLLVKADDNGDV